MAHNLKGRATASLETFSGVVTLAQPENLPEGASPRTQNTSFNVGAVHTRPGAQNKFSFSGGSVSALPLIATDIADGASAAWTNPNGIKGSSSFASVGLGNAGSASAAPQNIVSSGVGIPWNNPAGATGTNTTEADPLSVGPAAITSFSISGNVASFVTVANNFSAGLDVTLNAFNVGTYFNGVTVRVLSTGLSPTGFQASFTHADVGSTADGGNAMPLAGYASASVNNPISLSPGQYAAIVLSSGALGQSSLFGGPNAGGLMWGRSATVLDSIYAAVCNNGASLGPGSDITSLSGGGFSMPVLPSGAAVDAIYACVTGQSSNDNAILITMNFQNQNFGSPQQLTSGNFSGTAHLIASIGTTATDISTSQFTISTQCTINSAAYATGGFKAFLVVVYSFPGGGTPPAPGATQTLAATDCGFSVPSVPLNGFAVNLNAGVLPGGSGSLNAQLTLNGAPIGSIKSFALSSWPTSVSLGGSSDLWGTTGLTGADINGSTGLGVNIWGTVSTGGQIDLNNLSLAAYYPVASLSDYLDGTDYGFALTAPVTGLAASVNAYGSGTTMTLQLLINGTPAGTLRTFTPPASSAPVNFGGALDTWGLGGLTDAELNASTFGVRLQALLAIGQTSGNAYVQDAQLTAWITPRAQNFDYVTTFEDDFGNIYTLALDSSGEFWIEDVLNDPGVLSPLFSGCPADSFANSFTADSRQFIAISDLLKGNYPPQSYGQYRDRVSQVGPGAPPAFAGTLASTPNAPVTAYSASGGVLTLTAANSFTAGEVVQFVAAPADALYPLNGLRFNVLGTGLSSTQFEISTSLVTGSGTSAATATGQYTYPIAASPNGITQYPFWNSAQGYQSGFDAILWSSGPGQTSSGNVVTIYYLQASLGQPDANLVAAFQAQKFPVYIYVSGTPLAVANGTQLVTGVGLGTPPGGSAKRWYLTFNVQQTGQQKFGSGANTVVGQYQLTVATVTTTLPLPAVQTGDAITISGDPVPSWDNTWPIVLALNSGSYSISETGLDTSGTATYSWALAGATTSPPVAGQLVTVTNTLNDGGQLNVTDAVIATVSGISSGTFTITGFAPPAIAIPLSSDPGQATTSGTQYQIDPGTLTLGNSSANPIYGNSGGGYITLVGSSSVVITPGTRKGTVVFITRNGYWTAPAPAMQFTVGENSNYILVSNIPIGPPNVIARALILTEAGANGQPGASYYTIPEPVQFVYNGVTYSSSSFVIQDNLTTMAKLTFTDAVLLNAEEVDITGNDLFALGELGDAAWCAQYHGRSVWGRVNNKIQNFLNLSFDGGYLPNPAGNLLPLGWGLDVGTAPATSQPTLSTSPVFGNAWYISNQTGSAQTALGRITQSAYQDWQNVQILLPSTLYSVRVTCRTPSGATVGALVIDLTDANTGSGYGNTYGTFSLNLSAMTQAMQTYSGTLLTAAFGAVPTDLVLRLWAENLAAGGDVEIDRIEIFPTLAPQNLTGLTFSYKSDWESFDQVTGGNDTNTVNAQPANGAFVIHDQLYVVKESSLGYLSDTPNQEPANWNPFREVSNVAGAAGINAFDVGEEWAVMACQNGLFLFNGGAPVPIQLEVPDLWQAISWQYGHAICVRNNVALRKILVAVPMPTPNQWCPNFPTNAAPTQPNVILAIDYKGVETVEGLMAGAPMHVTMMGKLAVHDLRRKWSLWSIQSPYMAICKRNELYSEMLFCAGDNSSFISDLSSPVAGVDNGNPFPHSYCTYAFVSEEKAQMNPMLGEWNKRYALWDLLVKGQGTASLTFYQNTLNAPYPYAVPGGITLTDPAPNNLTGPLNAYGMRLFVEILMQGAGTSFNLSRVLLAANQDPWAPIR